MPDSILLSTRLHPFLGRHDGPSSWGLNLEGVHDPRRARQAESQRSSSGEMILEGRLGVVEARAIVHRLDLDASTPMGAILNPGHHQVTAATAVFEDIAPEFRGDSRYHGHFRCPKRRF
jgi:hypothetical protein